MENENLVNIRLNIDKFDRFSIDNEPISHGDICCGNCFELNHKHE